MIVTLSLCWFASDFSCRVIHGHMDKGIDGVDNERDHAQADGRCRPFARIQCDVWNGFAHGVQGEGTYPVDGEARDDDAGKGLPQEGVDGGEGDLLALGVVVGRQGLGHPLGFVVRVSQHVA